jgi:hypothetical protein
MKTTHTTLTSKTLTGIFALALLLTSLSQRGFAQTGTVGTVEGDKTTLEQNVYGLGLNFSLVSGMGISFKEHFAQSRFSYMVSGYVYKDHSGATYDYGMELQYDIYLKAETRFYAFAGASYFYDGGPVSQSVSQTDPITGLLQSVQQTVQGNQLTGPTRLGGGAGFETAISSSVCFYANLSLTSFQPSGDLYIYPYGGFMIYFK